MTVAQIIGLAINASMGLIVLSVGLNASLADVNYLLRDPGLFARSLLAMNIIMPVFAAVVVTIFGLAPAIKIALVAIALSPVPPLLPNKQTKSGGTAAYIVGLLVTTAVCSIVLVPLGIAVLDRIYGQEGQVAMATIASVVLTGVVAPLIIGVVVHQLAPAFAERIARWVALVGTVLLVAAFIPVLFTIWPALMAVIGNGTILILAVFTLAGVAVGHFLGGPVPDNRTVLALATGTRHPGVALAIASATFPQEKAVAAVVIWHLIVGAIVSGPYANWRKRSYAAAVGAAKPSGR